MSTFKFNQEIERSSKNMQAFLAALKEFKRNSKNMRALLAALKETTASELKTILKMNSYEIIEYPVKSKEYIIWTANKKDLEYAISIAPKTFKVKQG